MYHGEFMLVQIRTTSHISWRIHVSPNWNNKSFQIKVLCDVYTCGGIDHDNKKTISTWIATVYLHIFN